MNNSYGKQRGESRFRIIIVTCNRYFKLCFIYKTQFRIMIIFTIIILNSNCIKLYNFFFSNDVIFLKFYALAVSLFNKNSESSGGGISDVTSYP